VLLVSRGAVPPEAGVKPDRKLLIDDQVRVVAEGGSLLRESSSIPVATTSRAYTCRRCRETAVHDVPRQDNGRGERVWTSRFRTSGRAACGDRGYAGLHRPRVRLGI